MLRRIVPGITQREGHRGWVGMDAEARKNPAEGKLFSLAVMVELLRLICCVLTMCYLFAKFYICISYLIFTTDEVGNVISPILQTGKLSLREVQILANLCSY